MGSIPTTLTCALSGASRCCVFSHRDRPPSLLPRALVARCLFPGCWIPTQSIPSRGGSAGTCAVPLFPTTTSGWKSEGSGHPNMQAARVSPLGLLGSDQSADGNPRSFGEADAFPKNLRTWDPPCNKGRGYGSALCLRASRQGGTNPLRGCLALEGRGWNPRSPNTKRRRFRRVALSKSLR